MSLEIPKIVLNICKKMQREGFEIFIVGGAVRDLLMGKLLYDWDLTTNAKPDEILKVFQDAYYDNDFGTVGIPDPDEGRPYEITTYRTEVGYSDKRRPDKISWGKTLQEDLIRRDFTINSMAIFLATLKSNENILSSFEKNKTKKLSDKPLAYLIDLMDGKKDLKNKLIRAVGDPNERFSEDALRMMRAIRIATELGFTIEEKTFDAIKANATLINKISKERVRDELLKIFASLNPYEGMTMLRNSLLMQEILPEMEKTFGVEQKSPGRHHIYDVGKHSLMSLKNCPSTDPIVRFATFIHDVGKPLTYKKLENGTITFYNHELVSTKIAYRIAERLKFSNKQKEKFTKLVRWHQFSVDEHQTDSAIRRFLRNLSLEYVQDMLDLRTGDRLGGGASETSWRLEEFKKRLIDVQKQPFTVHDLKISGNDIMKLLEIKPSPKVGEILDELFNLVEDKKIPNEKKKLLKIVKEKYKK